MISCDIEKVGPEVTASQSPSLLPPGITEDMFKLEMGDQPQRGLVPRNNVSITMDNSLSPAHTLVQIVCQDHKGLLYDIMRTLKDYNIQVTNFKISFGNDQFSTFYIDTSIEVNMFCVQISYGRFSMKTKTECEVDLFIVQADRKKIVDPSKQSALCSRLRMELRHPLRIALLSRGPDTELLVANPVELSGKGRPLVFYDITLALKTLNTGIFSVRQ